MPVTEFQERVYTYLLSIPPGRVTTYAHIAKTLSTSPRAVGGALRNNPYAPDVPCHRVIASDGYIGGFKGEWTKAPSGVNQSMKLRLLRDEGVEFDGEGRLLTTACSVPRKGGVVTTVWFDGPWDLLGSQVKLKTIMEEEVLK
ncbi:6-O-methylguanine DNA methyltransferase [Exophiala viscosa]|uniref:Methylated-DNA--protein-cysteine methyltransferase n=1 Tax=Exophiala viscosa TaxID=2486360 RepID=A0AAN6DV98_9EURO|nr:6-O-methylguanine DNA methyltransferase [Exophiala viscosa]